MHGWFKCACMVKRGLVCCRRFGCNVCGEGGEYESLTLDCPLFRARRIVLDSWDVTLHSEGELAAVGVLHPTQFRVVGKSAAESADSQAETRHASVVEVPADFVPRLNQSGAAPAAEEGISVRLRISESRSDIVAATCSPMLPDSAKADEKTAADALAAALAATQRGLSSFSMQGSSEECSSCSSLNVVSIPCFKPSMVTLQCVCTAALTTTYCQRSQSRQLTPSQVLTGVSYHGKTFVM